MVQDSCGVVYSALQLVGHIVPAITSQAASVVGSGSSKAQQAMIDLHESAKEVELTDSLVVRLCIVVMCVYVHVWACVCVYVHVCVRVTWHDYCICIVCSLI